MARRNLKMKVLITAGPTREYIDPVRFISNPSTGKMGFLIAKECVKQGYEVVLVSGSSSCEIPSGVAFVEAETAVEMEESVVKYFPQADVLVMSAAVSDWRPAVKSQEKIKRKEEWSLKLVPTADILKRVAKIKKPYQRIIGFALETGDIIKNARKKLKEKDMDLIVADTPAFFGEGEASMVVFIYKDGKTEKYTEITKEEISKKIVSLIKTL